VKQIVVLSGKGGTGKTSVVAALAHLASQEMRLVLADADVDAANLELVLAPQQQEEHLFEGGAVAAIMRERCQACGVCAEVCRFDAIVAGVPAYRVEALACEGCAACFYQCPHEAIRMLPQQAGLWRRSDTRFGPLFHAHLFAGQENSGKLVTAVKQAARQAAVDQGADLLLVDGPPGIGCPVIAACSGADVALLVVEPTVAGVHDLVRVLEAVEHFGVKAYVLINKVDISVARAEEIRQFCQSRTIAIVGHVPYDDVVTQAMVSGQPVTEYTDGPVAQALRQVWRQISRRSQ
jgi:MinD superfamily P-loop ATPase